MDRNIINSCKRKTTTISRPTFSFSNCWIPIHIFYFFPSSQLWVKA
uniref:Uncharacterized protein n=1 Tax=Rhizophora mucronata TaxID=61149 RepID=A0A2P2JVX4_RHIMU